MKHRSQIPWILTTIFVLFLVFVVPAYADPNEVFDWGTHLWSIGPLSQSYTVTGTPSTNFDFTFTGNTNRFLGNSPQTTVPVITGGTAGPTLFIGADYAFTSESITLTIDLPTAHATGVSFTLMDIDTNPAGGVLRDEVVVTGSGSVSGLVIPTLTATNPLSVTVASNVATSTGTIANNNADGGNVSVNFGTTPINRIVIRYRPGPGSTPDPASGGVALYNITFTPSTPTAVSLQSFQAQTANATTPILLTVGLLTGITAVWAVQRRRQLKRVKN